MFKLFALYLSVFSTLAFAHPHPEFGPVKPLEFDSYAGGFYTTLGVGQSFLNPSVIKTNNITNIDSTDIAYKVGIGYRFNEHFETELGYADLGHNVSRGNVTGKLYEIDYQQLTLGVLYRPDFYKEFSPFVTAGIRKSMSNYNKKDELDYYLGIGGDIRLDDDEYPDLRLVYTKYSEDASSFFIETMQNWY